MAVGRLELTLTDVDRVQGLKGAINRDAEQIFAQFGKFPHEQQPIQRLFQRITEQGEGDKPVRTPEALSVLSRITGADLESLRSIVAAFTERGLLVARELENGETEVDLPHECVAWKWERLRIWIASEAMAAKTLRFLWDSVRAKRWLTGSVLSEAQRFRDEAGPIREWAKRYLAEAEIAGLIEWINQSERREKAERERLIRERQRARITAAVAGLVVLVVGCLLGWAILSQKREEQEKNKAQIALARSAVQDGIDLLEGRERPEPGQAVAYFARALRSAPGSVAAVSWLTDRLLRESWWAPVMSLKQRKVLYSAAFSPDGRRVVTAADDTAQVWDAANGKKVGAPLQHGRRSLLPRSARTGSV